MPAHAYVFIFNVYRLPASEVGMIIDKGVDFPQEIDAALRTYGESMWFFREQPDAATTRALNTYTGDHREYVPTPQEANPLRGRVLTAIVLSLKASSISPPGYV